MKILYPFSNRVVYFLIISCKNVISLHLLFNTSLDETSELESLSNMALGLKGHTLVVLNPEVTLEIIMPFDQASANNAEN